MGLSTLSAPTRARKRRTRRLTAPEQLSLPLDGIELGPGIEQPREPAPIAASPDRLKMRGYVRRAYQRGQLDRSSADVLEALIESDNISPDAGWRGRISIAEIAERTRYSERTVQRALNGDMGKRKLKALLIPNNNDQRENSLRLVGRFGSGMNRYSGENQVPVIWLDVEALKALALSDSRGATVAPDKTLRNSAKREHLEAGLRIAAEKRYPDCPVSPALSEAAKKRWLQNTAQPILDAACPTVQNARGFGTAPSPTDSTQPTGRTVALQSASATLAAASSTQADRQSYLNHSVDEKRDVSVGASLAGKPSTEAGPPPEPPMREPKQQKTANFEQVAA